MAVKKRTTYRRDGFYAFNGNVSFGVRSHRVRNYIEAFVAERQLRGLSAATLLSYQNELAMFASWIEEEKLPQDPSQWTPQVIKAYMSYQQRKRGRHGKPIAAITLRSYTSRLLAFLRWLQEEGYIPTDLASQIKKPKATYHAAVPFSDDELFLMMDAANDDQRNGVRDVAILYLLIDTGIRASELCGVTPDDILWDANLIKVLGKGDKERHVPISPACSLAMKKYEPLRKDDRANTFFQTEEGWAMTPAALLAVVKRIGGRANISKPHPHRFRHTFAVSFLRKGGNALVLQRLLGHTSLTMTNRYVNMVTDDLQQAHLTASPLTGLLKKR